MEREREMDGWGREEGRKRERKGKIGRGREDIAIYPSIHLPIRPSIVYLSKRQRQIDADWEELVAFWLSMGKSGSIYLSSLEGASRAHDWGHVGSGAQVFTEGTQQPQRNRL